MRLTEILFKCGVPIPVVGRLRMVLLLYGSLVVRRCNVLLLDHYHATDEYVLSAVV